MDEARIRAWWWQSQGLDGSLQRSAPATILERSGWARSVGGVSPYLALFARGGLGRETVDQAVARLEIHELQAARGCTYVVPATDFALGLKVGEAFAGAEMKTAYKLGVTDKEIDRLCDAVLKALSKGPLVPDAIREATGDASRNLGEEGKKKGMITTLPVALGRLQSQGEIRRVPTNGRLDQQRYQYKIWRPNPLKGLKLSAEEAYSELAKRYFRWIGPATVSEFQQFVGLGVKDTKAAVDSLKLVPVEEGTERLMFRDDHERLHAMRIPSKPQYALLGSIDAIALHLNSLLDPNDTGRPELTVSTAKAGGDLRDLPDHGIFDRGRLIGLWEYDLDSQSIVACTFGVKDRALDKIIRETEEFVSEQLGDARAFSLDSPKSRAPRIHILRKAAGK